MKKINKITVTVLAVILLLTAISGCGKTGSTDESAGTVSPFASFRDIPDVTEDEIVAIERLQKERKVFTYVMSLTTEAFSKGNGELGGYAALLCEWLTSLFDIRFKLELYPPDELIPKLRIGEFDFAGNVSVTDEHLEVYYMTDPIAERQYKRILLEKSHNLNQISLERPLRYAFPEDYISGDTVDLMMEDGAFEDIWVKNFEEAYRALENGDADAFIGTSAVEAGFAEFGNVYSEDFYPLTFSSVSMATARTELRPIISIVTKALRNGARPYIIRLFNQGYHDYMKYKLSVMLSDTEREYINASSVVPVVGSYDNYPVSFYNTREQEWQGIFYDLLKEITAVTGLSFKLINDNNDDWPVIYEMVKSGKAAFIADLIRTKEQEAYFIWPQLGIQPDYFALISKSDYPDLTINEFFDAKIGLARNTVYTDMIKIWFPNHTHYIEYENMDKAVSALQRGEVDMVMTTQRRLMLLTHYNELSGYKANIVFGQPIETLLGFNKNEEILCSIINKAFTIIDVKGISDHWMRRTYDYRVKVVQARLPWLISACVLSFLVVLLILAMFLRSWALRKQLSKLVAQETSTLAAILDGTPDHIFCKDSNLRFTRCNKSFEDFHHVRMPDIIGKNETEALDVSGDVAAYLDALDERVIDEKQAITTEELVKPSDGEAQLFETIRTPLFQDGELTGLVGMARNITRRKAAEEKAEKAKAEAQAATEAKSHFIANMSHEMRTPMNVIVGLTDLTLEEDNVPGNISETMKKINTAGNTLMGLINDVLDISKIEAGKLELTPVEYSVSSLLNDIITLNMIRIEEKPVTFSLDIDENLPCTLFGDDLRVKQILNNILSNAFKYTKEGNVTLGVSCQIENTTDSGVLVSLYISDTGIGIREEDVLKLFSDYNQVDTRANRTIEGTGLGLSITKKFVELMHGDISVKSDYGKGTTFRASIRQGFVTEKTIGKETADNLCKFRYSEEKLTSGERLVRSNLSYARVLVVDDFPMNLDVAAGMLGKYKMKVDCVLSGQDAIKRITAGEPVYDAVFMDHMMPGMDGIEATKEIRALMTKYALEIPIIALTANAVAGNEQMFLDNGFNAYLPKPFNAASLDKIVRLWVRDKTRER